MPLSVRRSVAAGLLVCGVVAPLAGRQSSLDDRYLALVDAYLAGSHESAVTDVLAWQPADTAAALRSLRRRTALYEKVAVSESDPDEGQARRRTLDYLWSVRAIAAMHLEAVVATRFDKATSRDEHLRVSEAALEELDATRNVPWRSLIDSADDDILALSRFPRGWYVVAATHFQRIGAFVDAARVAGLARREFPADAVFPVIEGSIFEGLASPVVSLDAARQRMFPALGPERVTAAALQRAQRAYQQALRLDPQDSEARIRLAKVLIALEQFDTAATALRDEAAPGRLAYLLRLVRGSLAEAQGRYDDAVKHFREAADVSSHWQSGCLALTHALVAQGQLETARDTMRGCAKREITADDPWFNYAMGLDWLVEPTVRAIRGGFSGMRARPDD